MSKKGQGLLRIRALEFIQEGRLDAAEKILLGLIDKSPINSDDFINLGTISGIRRDWDQLEKYSQKALDLDPKSTQAKNNLAIAFKNKLKYKEAIELYHEILKQSPKTLEPYLNLANILTQTGQFNGAIEVLQKSLKICPRRAATYNDIALAYFNEGDSRKAFDYFEKAIQSDPNSPDYYINYGNILSQFGKPDDALSQYLLALKIDEDNGLCLQNIASTLQSIGALQEALEFYKHALESNFESSDLYFNLGLLLIDLNKVVESAEAFRQAHLLDPGSNKILSQYIMSKKKIASWESLPNIRRWQNDFDSDIAHAFEPFVYIGHIDDPLMQYRNAEIYSKATFFNTSYSESPSRIVGKTFLADTKSKLRIGYFSSNYYNHPVLHLIKGVLQKHDTTKFEIYLFDTIANPPIDDPYLQAIEDSTLNYVHIGRNSIDEALAILQSYKLDVAIDLMGYTDDHKVCKLFSRKVAPVQINYLGFPGTTGDKNLHNYIIADDITIPRQHEKFYSEQIVRMPDCYLCTDNTRPTADSKDFEDADDLHIKKANFVFCCFNSIWKISMREFDIWMRLLKNIPGSIIWMRSDVDIVIKNLKIQAQARNIDPARLIFANRVDMDKHLARHRKADLFLDTFNYNAHATALDALWAGLPVLTMQGNSFPSRVGSSILTAAGLTELITTSEQEYEFKAQWLANHPEELQKLKKRLMKNRLKCSLFDTARTTQNLENIYIECWKSTQSRGPCG